jgi:catechol 2,3-dioxygenase-like lactoylglutathione lyase family enzyme
MPTDPTAHSDGPQRDEPGTHAASGRLLSVVFECADADAEGRFWEAVLGWVRHHDTRDWVTVVDPADRTHRLSFQRVDDHQPPTWPARTRPQQAHIDVLVDDLETAGRRVTALGARRLSESAVVHEQESFVVYADPAGHPFCCIEQAAPDL